MNLSKLPLSEILDLADLLLDSGFSQDKTVEMIAEILDELIDFRVVFPNTVGEVLEKSDRAIFATVIRIAVALAQKQGGDKEVRKQKVIAKLERSDVLNRLPKVRTMLKQK